MGSVTDIRAPRKAYGVRNIDHAAARPPPPSTRGSYDLLKQSNWRLYDECHTSAPKDQSRYRMDDRTSPSFADVRESAERIAGNVVRTPFIRSLTLSEI